MTNIQLLIVVPLMTIGMTAIIWLIYKYFKEKSGKEIEKGEAALVCFIVGVVCFFINYLWFVPQIIVGDVVKQVVSAQDDNCRNTSDITNEQCEYFQNVLNGKYNEYERPFDINSFLGK